jgi:hypothetical protein
LRLDRGDYRCYKSPSKEPVLCKLARIIHELATPTLDMNALPGVLGPRTLRRTVQVRLGFKPLRLPGGTFIFTVSQHQFMNYPGSGH